MTNRERYKAIARFQRPGDLWITDSFWQETLISWVENGGPPQLTNNAYHGQYFGFNHSRETKEIISGLVMVPYVCLLYTSPSPRDRQRSRMPSSA